MGQHTSTQKLWHSCALTFGGSRVQLMKVAKILLPRVLSDQMSVTQETSTLVDATYSIGFEGIPMPAPRSLLTDQMSEACGNIKHLEAVRHAVQTSGACGQIFCH